MVKALAVAVALALSAPAFAQTPDYLNSLPAADRVAQDLRGSGRSDRETAVRTSFALKGLATFVRAAFDSMLSEFDPDHC